MARYFSIKNFSKFQHYKDRSPPWIKLYNELLDDFEFGCLPDASKAHLILIWLLASRSENRLPYDADWIARRINATDGVDLAGLERAGFIVSDQPLPVTEHDASNVLALRKQDARPEREGETEGEGETDGARDRAPARSFRFEGRVIRIDQSQYDRWRKAYPRFRDFDAALQRADDYYAENPTPDGKWFFRVSRWLEQENAKLAATGDDAIYRGVL